MRDDRMTLRYGLTTTVEQEAAERTKSERLLQDDSADSTPHAGEPLSSFCLSPRSATSLYLALDHRAMYPLHLKPISYLTAPTLPRHVKISSES